MKNVDLLASMAYIWPIQLEITKTVRTMEIQIQVTCQHFENYYDGPNPDGVKWKYKGEQVFTFDVDEMEWMYAEDDVITWFIQTELPKHNNSRFMNQVVKFIPIYIPAYHVGKYEFQPQVR